eukprot:222090-Rhodomonas_salina.2
MPPEFGFGFGFGLGIRNWESDLGEKRRVGGRCRSCTGTRRRCAASSGRFRSRPPTFLWPGTLVRAPSHYSTDSSMPRTRVRASIVADAGGGRLTLDVGETRGTQLASGGNDNILNIWEARRNQSRSIPDRCDVPV